MKIMQKFFVKLSGYEPARILIDKDGNYIFKRGDVGDSQICNSKLKMENIYASAAGLAVYLGKIRQYPFQAQADDSIDPAKLETRLILTVDEIKNGIKKLFTPDSIEWARILNAFVKEEENYAILNKDEKTALTEKAREILDEEDKILAKTGKSEIIVSSEEELASGKYIYEFPEEEVKKYSPNSILWYKALRDSREDDPIWRCGYNSGIDSSKRNAVVIWIKEGSTAAKSLNGDTFKRKTTEDRIRGF